MSSVTHAAISAVWRIESSRLLGALLRFTGSVDLAEDLAQEALVAALESWPSTGIPDNPGAWLMATAKNRGIDAARRKQRLDARRATLQHAAETVMESSVEGELVEDDVLRLMLIACHPVLTRESRVALTLRLLGGLSTAEIARAFLTQEPTVAQRLVRAKRTLSEANIAFEIPGAEEMTSRLPAVLEVIYLIFNEGYAASAGAEWMRPELCQEALRLGRVLAALVPAESEVHGLLALMELHASRMRARVNVKGEPILLAHQDRSHWDWMLVRRGLAALERAEQVTQVPGPYLLQAAISACHARARSAEDTDWRRVVALYDALVDLTQSPVVELNRAVALAMAEGPRAGLEVVDALIAEGLLQDYHLLPAVRGDLLEKLERREEARTEFERAATLASNPRERQLLLDRAKRQE